MVVACRKRRFLRELRDVCSYIHNNQLEMAIRVTKDSNASSGVLVMFQIQNGGPKLTTAIQFWF